jgi:NADPH2:quinone reductase
VLSFAKELSGDTGELMATMRALVADAVGEPADVLRIRELPLPLPGPGQVRVRVTAAPVHASDLHIMRGRYGLRPQFPTVLGLECVGTIDLVGDGVDSVRTGDRVVTVGVTGTWQEFLVADADRVLPVPEAMSTSTACQLIANPLTAWVLVSSELGLGPDEWLLQTAAGSTVGQLVIQLSRHLGFRTLNVVRRRAAVAEIRALGGTEVVCTEGGDLAGQLAAMTAGNPITKAIDCVSGQVGADVSAALAPGGQLVVYGALSTHGRTDPGALTIPLFARSVIYEAKTVRGFWLYHWFANTPPARIRDTLADVISLVDKGAMTVPEGRPFPLDQAAPASEAAEAPAHGGKPLLIFD